MKMLFLITGEQLIKKKELQEIIKGLFFNSILSIMMEGLIEFVVYGFLNIYTNDTSTKGEILDMIFAYLSIFVALFLLLALIWVIFSKDEK